MSARHPVALLLVVLASCASHPASSPTPTPATVALPPTPSLVSHGSPAPETPVLPASTPALAPRCPIAGAGDATPAPGPDALVRVPSWRAAYARIVADVTAAASATAPHSDTEARARACIAPGPAGALADAPCPPGQPYYAAQTHPLDPITFRAERMFIVPAVAGDQLLLYGPVTVGGRLGNILETEAFPTGRFVVIESFVDTEDRSGSATDANADPTAPDDAPRDILVIDTATLRHAELHGPSLQPFALDATPGSLTVDGHGCHVTADTAPIP